MRERERDKKRGGGCVRFRDSPRGSGREGGTNLSPLCVARSLLVNQGLNRMRVIRSSFNRKQFNLGLESKSVTSKQWILYGAARRTVRAWTPPFPLPPARGRERESDSEKCNERNRLTRSLPVYTHLGTNRFSSFRRKPSPSFRRQDKKVQYIFIYIYIFIYTSCSDIDSPRFFQRKEEEEEEVDLESRAHLGFQSLFGYIKHVTQLRGMEDIRRHMRTCAKAISCVYIYIYMYM